MWHEAMRDFRAMVAIWEAFGAEKIDTDTMSILWRRSMDDALRLWHYAREDYAYRCRNS